MRLYTETAFHHEGDFGYLIELIDASHRAGVDGVKFQILLDASNLISTRHGGYATLSQYIFSTDQWREATTHALNLGLELVAMPLDLPACEFIESLNQPPRYQEIHPVCLNDHDMLQRVKQNGLPLIIGIGGRSVDEIRQWQTFFGPQLAVLMCGFQAFPSRLEDVKLERIPWLRSLFPDLTIGYADHSAFDHPDAIRSNDEAWQLGARLFEKHISVTEGTQRVDYESAVSPDKIAQIVVNLDALARRDEAPPEFTGHPGALAEMTEAEQNYRLRTKVVVAAADLPAGKLLGRDDMSLKMVDREGGAIEISDFVGRTLSHPVEADDLITEDILN